MFLAYKLVYGDIFAFFQLKIATSFVSSSWWDMKQNYWALKSGYHWVMEIAIWRNVYFLIGFYDFTFLKLFIKNVINMGRYLFLGIGVVRDYMRQPLPFLRGTNLQSRENNRLPTVYGFVFIYRKNNAVELFYLLILFKVFLFVCVNLNYFKIMRNQCICSNWYCCEVISLFTFFFMTFV